MSRFEIHPHIWCGLRLSGALFGGLLLAAGALVAQDEPVWERSIPGLYPASRYMDLWNDNLFQLETPEVAETVEKPSSLSREWELSGVSKIRDEVSVIVRNRVSGESRRLSPGRETGGLKLVSVTPNRDPGQVRATVERDGESAVLHFEKLDEPRFESPLDGAESRPRGGMASPAATSAPPPNPGSAEEPRRLPLRLPPRAGQGEEDEAKPEAGK